MALAGRIPRLSATIKRGLIQLGVAPGTPAYRAAWGTVGALSRAGTLPGPADFETAFAPGHAHVRRVVGENLWILYRFDPTYVDLLAIRNAPPVPADSLV